VSSGGAGATARWWPAMLLAVAVSFVALTAVVATSDAVPSADLTVARWVQGVDFPGWTGLLHLAAYLTDKPAGPAVVGALVLALWLRRLATEVIVLGIAQSLYVPQLLLKQLVQRPRPTEDLISITEVGEGFAFPSGHMTLSIALYGTVAMIAVARLAPGWRRNTILVACSTILTLSAISRPTFGAHWPSDALGSVLLGSVWLFAISRLYRGLRRPGGLPRPLRRPLALAESLVVGTTPQRLARRLRRA